MENRLTHNDVSCSVCRRPVNGNLNGEKIIICGRCVQLLLTVSRKNKIQYRDKLKEVGDLEGARSIESFIIEEDGSGKIATQKELVKKKGLRKVASELHIDLGQLYRSINSDLRLSTLQVIINLFGYDLKMVKRKEVTKENKGLSKSRR